MIHSEKKPQRKKQKINRKMAYIIFKKKPLLKHRVIWVF